MVADQDQIVPAVITATDEHGDQFDLDGLVMPIVIGQSEIAVLLAEYDPAVSASPSAADSRVIARVVMDALRKQQGL
jgi:hypothetical protein